MYTCSHFLTCTLHLHRLEYDASTNTYSDKTGVNVTVPGFGNTRVVECLEPRDSICNTVQETQYFSIFVNYFVAKGYQRGVDIRAAPYDWRLAAGEWAGGV